MGGLRLAIRQNPDLLLVALGAPLLYLLSGASLGDTGGLLWLLRVVLGIPYLYLAAGYPLTWLLYPASGRLSLLERFLLSLGFSLMATYPLGLLNVVREGQVDVFHPHLLGLLEGYAGVVGVLCLLAARARAGAGFRWARPALRARGFIVAALLVFALSLSLNLYDVGHHDFEVDDWALAKHAYDLIDGTFAARRAYAISFSNHPPMSDYAIHGVLQLLDPRGLPHIGPGVYRTPTAILEALTTLLVVLVGGRYFGARAGLLAGLVLAVDNYHVWRARMWPNEVVLALFFLLAMVFFERALKPGATRRDTVVAGLFLGGALLTKFTAILIIPVLFLFELLIAVPAVGRPREWPALLARALRGPLGALRFAVGLRATRVLVVGLLCFAPVVAFNLGAYLTTGYMDIAFSKIFNTASPLGPNIREYGGAPFSPGNLHSIVLILVDAHSLPVLLLLAVGSGLALGRRRERPVALLGLYLGMGLLFFYATGALYWHLSPLNFALAMLTGVSLAHLGSWRRRLPAVLLGVLVVGAVAYGAAYTVRTNYDYSYAVVAAQEGTPSLGEVAGEPYARILRQKHEDLGYSRLREALEARQQPGDLLVVRDDLRENIMGYPVLSVMMEKAWPDPWAQPEVRGPKDVDFRPKALRSEKRVALGEGGRWLTVLLSSLDTSDRRSVPGVTRFVLQAEGVYALSENISPEAHRLVSERARLLLQRYPPAVTIRGPGGELYWSIIELGPEDPLPW